jgi:sterol desaturase/sphingolipid hydroxylase (fatty acid hydroxylase superfamily)
MPVPSTQPSARDLPASPPPRLTWLSAPRRWPPTEQKIVGPIVLSTRDWSRPQPGEPQMFNQPFIEWFTTVRPATLPAVYVPLAAWMFWLGLRAGVSVSASIAWFVAGLGLWTLMEYVIHRFSFHHAPHGRFGVVLAYLIHGVHHAYPEDHRRWVTPPIMSLPIGLALYAGFSFVFGRYINSIGAGVAIGYMLYDLTHYLVHRGGVKSPLVKALRSHHMQHHYSSPERRFGVTSPFWDYVFRTHQ